MATTYRRIGSVTVGAGGAANIEFTSIPATYTDLLIVLSGRTSSAAVNSDLTIKPNGSATNGTYRYLQGSGSAVTSGSGSIVYGGNGVTAANATASTFGNIQIYIPNYTSSNNKSLSIDGVSENNAASAFATLTASLWSNSAAITSVQLVPDANFVQYSTATLYGISNGS